MEPKPLRSNRTGRVPKKIWGRKRKENSRESATEWEKISGIPRVWTLGRLKIFFPFWFFFFVFFFFWNFWKIPTFSLRPSTTLLFDWEIKGCKISLIEWNEEYVAESEWWSQWKVRGYGEDFWDLRMPSVWLLVTLLAHESLSSFDQYTCTLLYLSFLFSFLEKI